MTLDLLYAVEVDRDGLITTCFPPSPFLSILENGSNRSRSLPSLKKKHKEAAGAVLLKDFCQKSKFISSVYCRHKEDSYVQRFSVPWLPNQFLDTCGQSVDEAVVTMPYRLSTTYLSFLPPMSLKLFDYARVPNPPSASVQRIVQSG